RTAPRQCARSSAPGRRQMATSGRAGSWVPGPARPDRAVEGRLGKDRCDVHPGVTGGRASHVRVQSRPGAVAAARGGGAMIKRFHVLYVGQVELERVGRDGTPADARRYGNDRLSEPFFTARDVAQLMDELGFFALWTAEHHFQREGYECFPNLIQLSLWLATQTRRLKLGCAFNILPMWHPIRLAEDYAMADIVTDGRVIMGVGRGYHSREVETFGAPVIDQAANRALFEEQVVLLRACCDHEAFSHHGARYDCPPPVEFRGYRVADITCVPRPQRLPVDIWMPIASSKSIDYMASKGF